MSTGTSSGVTSLGLLGVLWAVVKRELSLALRHKGDVLIPLVFFVLIASLFPLGVGPESAQLQRMAPGVLWVGALLSTMLTLPRLFTTDHMDGSLEQMALSTTPLTLLLASKAWAHFILSGLPLVVIAPVVGLQFGLNADALGMLMLTLLLGTPTLSLLGSVGAALTIGLRGGGVLLALLILPLFIPVLIFGAGAVQAHMTGMGAGGHVSILAALLVLSAFFAPLATTLAVRISLE